MEETRQKNFAANIQENDIHQTYRQVGATRLERATSVPEAQRSSQAELRSEKRG